MKKHSLIRLLSGYEYSKIYLGVSNIINNNPQKNVQGNDLLIEKYTKILYNSNLVHRYTKLRRNKRKSFFDLLKMRFIKLKYNVFNDVVSREPNQSKRVVSEYIINILIKFLSKYHEFHKPLEFDITSATLSAKEKWAISVIEKEKIVNIHNQDFENLVKEKEKEIARAFKFGVRHRDDEEDFSKDIETITNERITTIMAKQALHKMDETGEFYKNYDKKNGKPKRKIFIIEFFKNLKKRFNFKWNTAKRSRAEIIIQNMKERLKIVEYNDFQKNFRNLDDKHVLALYNAADLNKRVQTIR